LRRLSEYCTTSSYHRYQSIYREGTPSRRVYLVQKGEIVLHKEETGTGRIVRLYVALRGDIFGIGEMMLRTYYTSATAIAPSVLIEIEKEIFVRQFLAIAAVRDQILLDFSKIVRFHIDRMVEHSGLHELALYLWHLSRVNARVDGGKIYIQTKVRQPEAAAVLNLSREHVTRLFRKLRLQGVVRFNKGFPVVDAKWLNAIVRDKDLAESIRYRAAQFQPVFTPDVLGSRNGRRRTFPLAARGENVTAPGQDRDLERTWLRSGNVDPGFFVRELAGICNAERADKLQCNRAARRLHLLLSEDPVVSGGRCFGRTRFSNAKRGLKRLPEQAHVENSDLCH